MPQFTLDSLPYELKATILSSCAEKSLQTLLSCTTINRSFYKIFTENSRKFLNEALRTETPSEGAYRDLLLFGILDSICDYRAEPEKLADYLERVRARRPGWQPERCTLQRALEWLPVVRACATILRSDLTIVELSKRGDEHLGIELAITWMMDSTIELNNSNADNDRDERIRQLVSSKRGYDFWVKHRHGDNQHASLGALMHGFGGIFLSRGCGGVIRKLMAEGVLRESYLRNMYSLLGQFRPEAWPFMARMLQATVDEREEIFEEWIRKNIDRISVWKTRVAGCTIEDPPKPKSTIRLDVTIID